MKTCKSLIEDFLKELLDACQKEDAPYKQAVNDALFARFGTQANGYPQQELQSLLEEAERGRSRPSEERLALQAAAYSRGYKDAVQDTDPRLNFLRTPGNI